MRFENVESPEPNGPIAIPGAAAAVGISLPMAPGIDAVSRERVIERLVAACESQGGWANRRAAWARPRRDCQLGSGRSRTGSQIRW